MTEQQPEAGNLRDELSPGAGTALDTAPAPAPAAPAPEEPPRRGRRRLRRLLIGLGTLVLVLVLLIGGGLWYLTDRYAGNVARVDGVFSGLDESSRPAESSPTGAAADAVSADPVTFLLVGSDTRADITAGETPDARSDAIMVARFSADRQHAQIVSIPRDSWVDIPGHGKNKINAAYAYGGPSLLIQTVENLTGVRIDHYAAISFNGLIDMTDALGGVDVTVAETTTWGPYTFTAGVNHLDGDMARWYVGQRYGLAGGDFDREKRQQNYLRAMFTKLLSQGTFSSPGTIDAVLKDVTGSVAVDSELSNTDLLSLAYSLRNVKTSDVDFFTAPVLGTGMEGASSVVYLDANRDARMWGYLQTDSLSQNADEFSDEALGDNPR